MPGSFPTIRPISWRSISSWRTIPPSAEEEKTQGSETDAKTLPESEEKTWFFPGPAGSDADYSMESLWVHSPQFAARTKQFLVTPDTPLFVSAANQKVNMSDWRRTEFHCENGMVLARRPHFTKSDGISRRPGTSDSGSRMISTPMQAGERVSRYEADRSVMENTDP